MPVPFVIDNQDHRLADVLKDLLARSAGTPLDIATAYFSISGYRLIRDGLHELGAFRLLLGAEPETSKDIGLRPNPDALRRRMQGDLEAEPFSKATRDLVADLTAFLRSEQVEVRLYDRGFLHAKAYLFHQDRVGARNRGERRKPYAGIVGSSNFTGPGLASNKELNLVHRVFLDDDSPIDHPAAAHLNYLDHVRERETLFDPSGIDLPEGARRAIKSEVGARAIHDLTQWFERQWANAVDFKGQLLDLLDASKFGERAYTPYEIFIKALYEYFKEELGADAPELGRSAIDLADFQTDAVKKARRILARYDGVLIADSVGLGKTWVGKKLLEDFAYHRRQKALVICPASLRAMWERELATATIAAQIVGMEELGRDGFDPHLYHDADVILIDESHNFRNDKSKRYLALETLIQLNGGRGRDGEPKKVILLSATPINNDLYDLASQVRLFTQSRPDYFREAGIGDLTAYFRRARRIARTRGAAAGEVLFDLLEEIIVRNTRPYIRSAYPNATIRGEPVRFPDRRLHTIEYDLGATYGGLYGDIVAAIEALSLAPYKLETYRKPTAVGDEVQHKRAEQSETALVGIFKTRFLKRLESSVEAFRLSLQRALVFEETYKDYLLDKKVVASGDFQRALRFLVRDDEDDTTIGSLADQIDAVGEARDYIAGLPTVDLNDYDLRTLIHDVDNDIALLRDLYERTAALVANDGKLARLKQLLSRELRDRKVLIFTSFKDTARYLEAKLTDESAKPWRRSAGNPVIQRIDSGNSPGDRTDLLARFAPIGSGEGQMRGEPIDILISTDVLSEGQNLQDCGVIINYDLTWNPIRLVQRNGRIDRIGSPHDEIGIYNFFPQAELEDLLHLVERLTSRLLTIDDLGLLDASVLGEVVHPRAFNTLHRLHDEDATVLDEEEARAELAGPEMLLQRLREMLNRVPAESIEDLPNGIHSGLRREGRNGIFFYFQAPRADGQGRRHFWRYIDAATHEIAENRYEIAQMIACPPDEPRCLGDQDVFALQDRVIDHILAAEQQLASRAIAAPTVEPIQQTITETINDAIRRRSVDREQAKACRTFLGQPMGKALHVRLRTLYEEWRAGKNDGALVEAVFGLAQQFGKERAAPTPVRPLTREDLELICFEFVSS